MALVEGVLHEDGRRSTVRIGGRAPKTTIIQTLTVGAIKEMATLGQLHHELRIVGRDGHWYRVRASGRLRTWKRDPHRVELPVKYGMYESLTLTSHDFDTGKVGIVASS